MRAKIIWALAISTFMSSVSMAGATEKWDPSVQATGKISLFFNVHCLASGRINPVIKLDRYPETVSYGIKGKEMRSRSLELKKFNFEVRDSRELWVRTANDQAAHVGQLDQSLDDIKLGNDYMNKKVCAEHGQEGRYLEGVSVTLKPQVQLVVNAADFEQKCKAEFGNWGTGDRHVKVAPQLVDLQNGEVLATGETDFISYNSCVNIKTIAAGVGTAAVTPVLVLFHLLGWGMH